MKPRRLVWFLVVPLVALVSLCPCGIRCMVPDAHETDAGTALRTPGTTRGRAIAAEFGEFASRARCPKLCRCTGDSVGVDVECVDSNLTKIPEDLPASATRLVIKNNDLSTLENYAFRDLTALEVLELSHNAIKQIGFHSFQPLPKLGLLDLSNNELSNILVRSVFRNLTRLSALNLSANAIDYVDEFCFTGLRNLTVLRLNSNKIKHIHRNSFLMLANVELLDLSSNLLTSLVPEWFWQMTNLRTLFLKHNQINTIEDKIFRSSENLRILDLSYNFLNNIETGAFANLKNLEHLDLKGNRLRQLPNDLFHPLRLLSYVDLSGNKFSDLHSLFVSNAKLDTIYLNNLPNLSIIHDDMFLGLGNLRQLWITNNPRLHFIQPLAFAPLKSLQLLHLSQNNLSTLHEDILFKLKRMQELALNGNKWNCDCTLAWLFSWVNTTQAKVIDEENTRCALPQEYQGSTVYNYPWQDLNCTNVTITSVSAEVQSRVGATALLECQAEGNPPPSLTWVLPRNYIYHWYPPDVEGHWYIPHQYDHPVVHDRNRSHPGAKLVERIRILKNGNLFISHVHSIDAGTYLCLASNSLGNDTYKITLSLNYQILIHVKLISILVGLATSVAMLLLLLIFQLISMALNRWGCCCCEGVMSPKAKQIRKMLESVEQYKTQQLERLRDNYTMQVHKIKDNCTQQMERIRESYSTQAERLRDIRDFGTQQIDRVRDQYFEQVKRVRDYSFQQMNKVRENYIFQRNRIRKFSAHQLLRLRENYKLQQQHLNKILETLNIESCRTGCSRTDSLVFNPDALMDNVFITNLPPVPVTLADRNMADSDQESQRLSYFTPLGAESLASLDLQSASSCPATPSINPLKPLAGMVKSMSMDPTVERESPSPFTLHMNDYAPKSSGDKNGEDGHVVADISMDLQVNMIESEEGQECELPEVVCISDIHTDSSKETSV